MNIVMKGIRTFYDKGRIGSKRLFLIFMMSFICYTVSGNTWGIGIINAPLPIIPCPAGSSHMLEDKNLVCATGSSADVTGSMLVGAGAKYEVGVKATYVGIYNNAYPPFTGMYTDKIYICQATAASKCTIKQASDSISGLNTFYLSSKYSVGSQEPDAGGPAVNKTIPYAYSFCQVIVDPKGVEWASEDGTSCSDAHHLPKDPADCFINYGEDLNVDMGDIERSKIPTTASIDGIGNVKKQLNVLCTRDSAVTVNTTFQVSPITINGQEVIPTGLPGLGIALFYRGKLVTPTDIQNETYATGYSDFDLEFAPVRDATVAVKNLPTGQFSANVVMVMAEQ